MNRASTRPTIRIASYNMRKGIGTDRRRNPERILDVLDEIGADVVALQEADRRFGERQSALPQNLMDIHGRYRPVALCPRPGGIGWHGNAILVGREVEVIAHDLVHLPCLEPRGAVRADLSIGGAQVRLFAMHLDLSGLWRRRQAAAILHAVDQPGDDMATVLAGDTNEWTPAGGCLRDFSRSFTFAPCGRSFHARRPIARLDRIMHRGGLKLMDCGVHDSANARKASDHLPIWADYEPA